MIFYTVLLILFFQLIGVPVRLEIGPKDKERKQITVVLRHTGARSTIPVENSETKLGEILEQIHSDLYKKYENQDLDCILKTNFIFYRAKQEFDSHTILVKDWTAFLKGLDNSCILLAPFCGEPACEDLIKKDSAR